jgi:hypothetical protein
MGAKCVIFPKGKTTWKGFVPPCKFKDGDIISDGNYVAIFYKIGTPCRCTSHNVIYYHCYYSQKYCKFKKELDFGIGTATEFKYATEEEKQKLFDAIKANGYKWNAETKTLEKIKPEFKVGDKIKRKGDTRLTTIKEVRDDCYIITFKDVFDNAYITDKLLFSSQDEYEIIPNKFDINTLKPFDKVLVRLTNGFVWMPKFFSYYDTNSKIKYYPFVTIDNIGYSQCIPYEDNKHLSNTTDDCAEYYKTW